MAEADEFKLKTQKCFQVQCAFDTNHVFEKVFEVEEGIGSPSSENDKEGFCPFCGKKVTVTIKGEAPEDTVILRRFAIQEKELSR